MSRKKLETGALSELVEIQASIEEARRDIASLREELIASERACDLDALARVKYSRIPGAALLLASSEERLVRLEANEKISLKSARVNAGYKLKEAAKHLGVNPNSLNRWEKEDRVPKMYHLQALCKLYDWPMERLDLKGE